MPNKTISLPDDVIPIIDDLDQPFSRWVAEQLRRHGAQTAESISEQLTRDATLADAKQRPTRRDARAIGQRMERSAPW